MVQGGFEFCQLRFDSVVCRGGAFTSDDTGQQGQCLLLGRNGLNGVSVLKVGLRQNVQIVSVRASGFLHRLPGKAQCCCGIAQIFRLAGEKVLRLLTEVVGSCVGPARQLSRDGQATSGQGACLGQVLTFYE